MKPLKPTKEFIYKASINGINSNKDNNFVCVYTTPFTNMITIKKLFLAP